MKNRVITFTVLILLSIALCLSSCEQSNIALAEIIRTSQPRNDIRWSEAIIVKSSDGQKAVAAVLISEKGVHVIKKGSGSIADATIPNRVSEEGVFSRVFIPVNYDQSTNNNIILEAGTNIAGKNHTNYYKYNLGTGEKKLINFEQPTGYDTVYGFVQSHSFNSENIVYRTTESGKYLYCITRFKLNDNGTSFGFSDTDCAYFSDSDTSRKVVYLFESENKKYAVAAYTIAQVNENKYSLRYATVELDTNRSTVKTLVKIEQISEESGSTTGPNLFIDYFKVYDEEYNGKIEWMGIGRTGLIYHSHAEDSQLRTKDASFMFYRYVAPVSLEFKNGTTDDKDDIDGDKYGLMLFARYNGSGFIVTRFRRHLNNNNRLVEEYKRTDGNSYQNTYVITSGFVENFRTEEVSVFAPIYSAASSEGIQSVIVLTTEAGASTYKFFDNPYAISVSSSQVRDKIDIPFVDQRKQ